MATQLQIRRGTSAQVAAFTGAEGEIVVNTTNDSVHVNDGSSAGGFEMARVDGSNWAITNNISTTANISFGDNDKAIFGADNDLQIYSDGTNAIIKEDTGGSLYIGGADVHLMNPAFTEYYISATANGAVTLRHDNALKLATTSTGIDVTGTVTATAALEVLSGVPYIDWTDTATTDEDTRAITYNGDFYIGTINDAKTTTKKRFLIDHSTGDISFYNSSGTSQSLFWDSSAESLGIGTTSPSRQLSIYGTNDGYMSFNGGRTGNHEFVVGTDSVGFVIYDETLDTYRLVIDQDSGNVGIGTSSPYSALTVDTANGILNIANGNSSGGTKIQAWGATPTNGYLAIEGYDKEYLRIDASGQVGIGTTSPNYSLTSYKAGANANYLQVVNGSSGPNAANGILYGLDGAGNGVINKQGAGDLITSVAGSEAMRIAANGNLLVGTTSFGSNVGVQARGSSGGATDEPLATSVGGTGSIVQIGFFNPNGRVGYVATSGTSTSYSTSSDQRLKDNIVDAPSASDDIDAIQVRSFDWKADGSHQKYGMVAQELQGVAPEAVTGDADSDEMMGVDYSKLVPMLVKEIQSLRGRVQQLENN